MYNDFQETTNHDIVPYCSEICIARKCWNMSQGGDKGNESKGGRQCWHQGQY